MIGALNSSQSLGAKRSFEAEIVPLLSHYDETRTVTPHFYKCFMPFMASQKICIKEKNLDGRSCIFSDTNDVKTPHLEPERSMR